nr:hypothetical protein [uncultured Oscillibacter sp.]
MASEYLKWKYRDVRPEKPLELTKKQRRQNWWHYHKWHVLIGVAVVLIGADWGWNILTQVTPDYQIAYVGSVPLSEGDGASWETQLAAFGTDCNGDGKVVVQLKQYLASYEDAMYNAAANVRLLADLDGRESYFFLLEDPEKFQADYEVLEEDWFPVAGGLYLARRAVWGDRTAEHMEEYGVLWARLLEEAS